MVRGFASALCLIAAAAALCAPAAQATPLMKATSYPAKIKSTSVLAQVFKTPNAAFKCKGLNLTGTLAETTSTVTLAPTYSECTYFEAAVSSNSNGCTYQFHLQKQLEGEGETKFEGTLDIVCPAGKSIQFTGAGKLCSWFYGSQTGRAKITLENQFKNSPDDLVVYFAVTGLEVTETSAGGPCGSGTFKNGTLEGAATLQAETEKSEGQNLWVA
jgi:hypothetical protein